MLSQGKVKPFNRGCILSFLRKIFFSAFNKALFDCHQVTFIEPFGDLRTQTSTENTDLLSKSQADVHMSRYGSIVVRKACGIDRQGASRGGWPAKNHV